MLREDEGRGGRMLDKGGRAERRRGRLSRAEEEEATSRLEDEAAAVRAVLARRREAMLV
jgi:hypothetical protein